MCVHKCVNGKGLGQGCERERKGMRERKCVCACVCVCVLERECVCVSSFTKLHSRHVRVTDPHFSLEFIFSPLSISLTNIHTHSLTHSHTHSHSHSHSYKHTHTYTHSHSYKYLWIFKLPSWGVDSQSQFSRKCIFVEKGKNILQQIYFRCTKMIGDDDVLL